MQLYMTQTNFNNALARECNCKQELIRCNVLLETSEKNENELKSQLNISKTRESESNLELKQLSIELTRMKALFEASQQQIYQLEKREQNQSKELNVLTRRENELTDQLKISKENELRANSDLNQMKALLDGRMQTVLDHLTNMPQYLKQPSSNHVSYKFIPFFLFHFHQSISRSKINFKANFVLYRKINLSNVRYISMQ
jgi:chromosome segregation ATPase